MSTNAVVNELQSSWVLLFPDTPPPSARQLALWITAYGTDTVRSAITKLAVRSDRASGASLYKFAAAIMGRIARNNNNATLTSTTSKTRAKGAH